jgi:L-iditol 2-dehydrogenase
VIGVTRSQSKRDLASELGAHLTVAPDEAKDAVANETDGRGANIVIEAVGTEATFSQAINLAGHASTVVLFGTTTGGSEGLPYYQFYFKEITIKNPRAATKSDYERSIALIASGTVQVERIISRSYSLNDANDAFAAVKESSTLKILMDVAGS